MALLAALKLRQVKHLNLPTVLPPPVTQTIRQL